MKKCDPYYKTKRWQSLRKRILQRDGYQCQVAKQYSKMRDADTVHHIFPREDYPEYQWCEWNLISCSHTGHNLLHDRNTNKLTKLGRDLMKATAQRQGIDLQPRVTLVIGNPGTGKTTYVRENLGRGLCYDLDAIAAAFRLKDPKEERHEPARWLANSLIKGFATQARKYSDDIYIIRTAPTIEEIQDIRPTKLVVMYGGYGNDTIDPGRRVRLAQRIKAAVEHCKRAGVKVEEIDRDG